MNRPKSVVCYICGREYGTHSIDIHIKSCIKKWETEQAQKPKKDRKPLPQPPQGFGCQDFKNMDQSQLEQLNSNTSTYYNDVSLIPCQNCGRTFREEALAHHIKGCSEKNPYKAGTEKTQDLVPCQKCGRKFAPDRVGKHSSVCKGGGSSGGGGSLNNLEGGNKPSHNKTQSSGYDTGLSQSQVPQRPKTLMCYICGREYGTKSLSIHLKSCKEKFQTEQEKKPKSERKNLPSEPFGLQELLAKPVITHKDIEDYNNNAFNKYNTEGLEMCENCGRTFTSEALSHHKNACSASQPFEGGNLHPCSKCGRKFVGDRVKKHEQVCKGGDGKGQQIKKDLQKPQQQQQQYKDSPKVIKKPKTLVCYICGREYGTTSLKIHIPQCEKKWENEQAKLPKSQQRPVPQPPQSFLSLENATQGDIDKFNDEAFNQYNNSSLLKCPNCFRTFTSEALKHHEKSCTKDNPAKLAVGVDKLNIGGNNNQDLGEEVIQQGNLVPCEKCGRKFAEDRIQKHQNVCKGAKK